MQCSSLLRLSLRWLSWQNAKKTFLVINSYCHFSPSIRIAWNYNLDSRRLACAPLHCTVYQLFCTGQLVSLCPHGETGGRRGQLLARAEQVGWSLPQYCTVGKYTYKWNCKGTGGRSRCWKCLDCATLTGRGSPAPATRGSGSYAASPSFRTDSRCRNQC